jgi:hypothetical protein
MKNDWTTREKKVSLGINSGQRKGGKGQRVDDPRNEDNRHPPGRFHATGVL